MWTQAQIEQLCGEAVLAYRVRADGGVSVVLERGKKLEVSAAEVRSILGAGEMPRPARAKKSGRGGAA